MRRIVCGICGVVDVNGEPIERLVARRMRDVLAHRGPDGEGEFASDGGGHPSVLLGHRRLKVIDLTEAANQPLANEDGTVWVTFNGEIYNYRELARTLAGQGHAFRSQTDTEVIVHGYEEYGDQVVERLDGMFAFAIWDVPRSRLLLARDRVGKKPLYYHFDGRRLTFASEIKGLLVCPWVPKEVDHERIPEYLCYGYVGGPRTLYKGIFQLEPATRLAFDAGRLGEPQRYWRMSVTGTSASVSFAEACGSVRERLTSAVRKRLISDVPLGAFLSGGVDSSIVVGLMSQIMSEPVRTFTIGFDEDPSYDEREPARLIAERFGTSHNEYSLRPNAAQLIEKLLWHHDQPYGDSSAIPTYMVSLLARDQVTVALVGDGGDEIFAGYRRFLAALLTDRVPPALQRIGLMTARFMPRGSGYFDLRKRVERFSQGLGQTSEERYRRWVSIFSDDELGRVLHPDLRPQLAIEKAHRAFLEVLDANRGNPLLNRLLEFNFATYLPDDLMVKVDRTSMANSLETRSPMLDKDLTECVSTLPPHWKLNGRKLKFLLKEAFADLIPASILKRPKHGFGVPIGKWFQQDLEPMYRDLVLDTGARSGAYIDAVYAERLLAEHLDGSAQHGDRLWVVLNLELWLRLLEQPVSARPPRADIEVEALG